MKKILLTLIFVLILQNFSHADDIRDFEVEGMSIGSSLLENFSEKEIKLSVSKTQYTNDKFIRYDLENLVKLKNYNTLSVYVKKNDNKYIISGLSGILQYEELNDCLQKKTKIKNEVEKLFKFVDKQDGVTSSNQDKTGKSKLYSAQYYFKPYPSDEAITIQCYHFTEESMIQRVLKLNVNSEYFANFIVKESQ